MEFGAAVCQLQQMNEAGFSRLAQCSKDLVAAGKRHERTYQVVRQRAFTTYGAAGAAIGLAPLPLAFNITLKQALELMHRLDGALSRECQKVAPDPERIRQLVGLGANRHMGLWFAAHSCNLEASRLLLDLRANPDARTSKGTTALMATIIGKGTSGTVLWLLCQRGADVNAETNDGETALEMARCRMWDGAMEDLKAFGAKDKYEGCCVVL
jgi:hypothetical protein